MDKFDALRKEWGSQRIDGLPKIQLFIQVSHHIGFNDFYKELTHLGKLTRDPRFARARQALFENGLVSDGKKEWRHDYENIVERVLVPEIRDRIAKSVGLRVENGMSLRRSCAFAVVELRIKAASFEAAVKAVERIWRDLKREGVNPTQAAERLQSDVYMANYIPMVTQLQEWIAASKRANEAENAHWGKLLDRLGGEEVSTSDVGK